MEGTDSPALRRSSDPGSMRIWTKSKSGFSLGPKEQHDEPSSSLGSSLRSTKPRSRILHREACRSRPGNRANDTAGRAPASTPLEACAAEATEALLKLLTGLHWDSAVEKVHDAAGKRFCSSPDHKTDLLTGLLPHRTFDSRR